MQIFEILTLGISIVFTLVLFLVIVPRWRTRLRNLEQPRWVYRNWRRIQFGGIASLFIVFGYFLLGGSSFLTFQIAYLIILLLIGSYFYPPKRYPIAEEKLLGTYISLTESMLYRSDTPVEEFQYLIYRFVTLDKLSQDEIDSILKHFAGRADNIGVEARRLLSKDEELLNQD